MNNDERAEMITKDILVNHLPRIQEGLQKGYVDENQIMVMLDHAMRARMLQESTTTTHIGLSEGERLLRAWDIIAFFKARKGFTVWWSDIDEETRDEIVLALAGKLR